MEIEEPGKSQKRYGTKIGKVLKSRKIISWIGRLIGTKTIKDLNRKELKNWRSVEMKMDQEIIHTSSCMNEWQEFTITKEI